MAITVIAEPQVLTPAHNPAYWYFDSTNKTQVGHRYLVALKVGSDTIGTWKLRGEPLTGYGVVDISKLLQSLTKPDLRFIDHYKNTGQMIEYTLQVDEEYFVNVAFSDYEFAGSAAWANFSNPTFNPNGLSRTMLVHAVNPNFLVGDVVNVAQTPSVNFRAELEGIHTVLDVFEVTGTWYTVLDLPWIGSGAASAGNVTYADGKKTIVSGITTSAKDSMKSALTFNAFQIYDHTDFILDGATKLLLTSKPDDVRISRNHPTWLTGFAPNGSYYVTFNIGDTLYRYQLAAGDNELITFNILPSTSLIEEVFSGGVWIPFVGTINLTNIKAYTVQLFNALASPRSKEYAISLYSECDFFDKFDVCFMDRLGSWLTIPFYKAYTQNQAITRDTYRKKYGSLSSGDWVYALNEAGEEVFHAEEQMEYTIHTGQLNVQECAYLRELMTSPKVYINQNDEGFKSAIITNNNYNVMNKRMARQRILSITFRYSVNDQVNA